MREVLVLSSMGSNGVVKEDDFAVKHRIGYIMLLNSVIFFAFFNKMRIRRLTS